MVRGYYHSTITMGTVDGPGMRYVLFLSGCALGCTFCHNPDTWVRGSQTISVQEVLADYERYRPFYEASGGGLTVSGGEPILQSDFVAALFAAAQAAGIHTTLDTSGYGEPQALAKILPNTDLVLFSLKALEPMLHQRLTISDNGLILANLAYVAERVPLVVRYVIIPAVNDRPADLARLALVLKSCAPTPTLELLKYHKMGEAKWQALGMTNVLSATRAATEADIAQACATLAELGIEQITY